MTLNDPKWPKMIQMIQMIQNDPKWSKMIQNDKSESEWPKMTPNDSKWLKMTKASQMNPVEEEFVHNISIKSKKLIERTVVWTIPYIIV